MEQIKKIIKSIHEYEMCNIQSQSESDSLVHEEEIDRLLIQIKNIDASLDELGELLFIYGEEYDENAEESDNENWELKLDKLRLNVARLLEYKGFNIPNKYANIKPGSVWEIEDDDIFFSLLKGISKSNSPNNAAILIAFSNDEEHDIRNEARRLRSIQIKNNDEIKIKIFLCHAKEDSKDVKELYENLQKDGFHPWMDEIDILPGQDWNLEIQRAIKNSEFIVVCLSNFSVSKSGYVNKEIKWALDRQDEMQRGSIFLIPIRLEECPLPDHFSEVQCLDIFKDRGFERLVLAIKFQLNKKGIELPDTIYNEENNNISIEGQWADPADNDTLYIKQFKNNIIGFYNFDGRNSKVGIIKGKLLGSVLEYRWRWLNNQFQGHGKMVVSEDRKQLSGDWWYYDNENEIERLGYRFVSDEMPKWLSNSDFKNELREEG